LIPRRFSLLKLRKRKGCLVYSGGKRKEVRAMNEERDTKTFKEYPLSDADRQSIVNALKEDGFSEEQLNAMPPERVWELYVNSMTEIIDREFSKFARVYQNNPQLAPLIDPLIKRMNRQLEDLGNFLEKELEKQLEKKLKKNE
jgi:hypothetical protein